MKKLIRIFMLLDIIEELRAKNKRLVDRNRKLLEENRILHKHCEELYEENKALRQMLQKQEDASDIPVSLTVTDVKEGE